MFQKTVQAGWGDMDFNAHMRNTAYLDKSADVRMMFFAEHGFAMSAFMQRGLGPVVMRDEVDYYREVALLEVLRVRLSCAGMADDGSRFRLRNEFERADGKLAARVTSTGGWLDRGSRRLVAPPVELLAVLRVLGRTDDFETLPSSLR